MSFRTMAFWIGELLERAVQEHFPEDKTVIDASMAYLPNDAGQLLPIGVIYIQIDGTENVDGLYLIDTVVPSLISEELVDALVKGLADQSADRRAEIRTSIEAGDTPVTAALPQEPRLG